MSELFIGIDVGTSGVRAVAIDNQRNERAKASASFTSVAFARRDARAWWQATETVLTELLAQLDRDSVRAMAIDGTSGTVLPVDAEGAPLALAKLYNDRCEDDAILRRIAAIAPEQAAVHGATSALARVIGFSKVAGAAFIQHEADWVASQLSGRIGLSDENNALKSGYDPIARLWPDWLAETGVNTALLPEAREPGSVLAPIAPVIAKQFELPPTVLIAAGTTDGCASFLATGADRLGDGVTTLGTTLTIKVLSAKPIIAPQYGIYSHRIGDFWLAGGASNSGGAALLAHFDEKTLQALSCRIDPETSTGLDYYPLPAPGERFPINNPQLEPRITPRPAGDAEFLQALFEGIASVEALAYRRIFELGGPQLTRLRTVGGGARNSVWTRIRERLHQVPFHPTLSSEAATGTALLAQKAVQA